MRRSDLFILIISLIFMGIVIVGQWQNIIDIDWVFNGDILVVSLLGLIVVFFLDAFGWYLILRSLGVFLPVKQSISIWLISSLARYIPGGVWSYASRVSLATRQGVDMTSIGISLYLETLLLMSSAVAVGVPSLLSLAGFSLTIYQASLILLILGILMHPRVIMLLRFIPGRVGKAMLYASIPSFRIILYLYIYYVFFWIIFGFVFTSFVYSVHPIEMGQISILVSALAMSFFVGFVIVIAPGGVGIRESVLYLLLVGLFPSPLSLVIAVCSRIWIIIGELLSIGLSLVWIGGYETQKINQRNG